MKLDLEGRRFGMLVAKKPIQGTRKKKRSWLCECDCGNTVTVPTSNLTRGNSKSCGCRNTYDLSDMVFGRLTVLYSVSDGGRKKWACLCDCGNQVSVVASSLLNGDTRSCGCLKSEKTAQRSTTHGYTRNREYHPLYQTWLSMIARCHKKGNRAYRNYGGRGIFVCDRWHDFENFLTDMGERPTRQHTLERIDNNAGYSPDNCVWATRAAQARNTRRNHLLVHDGKIMTIADWSDETGIAYFTIASRIYRGWSTEDALTTPVNKTKRNRYAGGNINHES